MTSAVDICNLALTNIRAATITALDDSSQEAIVCTQRYSHALQYVLKGFPWNFAHKVAALSLLSEDPHEWLYAYDYPSDALHIKHIVGTDAVAGDRTIQYHFNAHDYQIMRELMRTRIPFEIGQATDGSRAILTDEANAYVAYTQNITDPNQFDPAFIEALSWYLSSMIAVPVVGADKGRQLREDALKMYSVVMANAQASNANESWNTAAIPESPTITARR